MREMGERSLTHIGMAGRGYSGSSTRRQTRKTHEPPGRLDRFQKGAKGTR